MIEQTLNSESTWQTLRLYLKFPRSARLNGQPKILPSIQSGAYYSPMLMCLGTGMSLLHHNRIGASSNRTLQAGPRVRIAASDSTQMINTYSMARNTKDAVSG